MLRSVETHRCEPFTQHVVCNLGPPTHPQLACGKSRICFAAGSLLPRAPRRLCQLQSACWILLTERLTATRGRQHWPSPKCTLLNRSFAFGAPCRVSGLGHSTNCMNSWRRIGLRSTLAYEATLQIIAVLCTASHHATIHLLRVYKVNAAHVVLSSPVIACSAVRASRFRMLCQQAPCCWSGFIARDRRGS